MKEALKIALILLTGATVSRMVQKKQNVFPIHTQFENAIYTNNGYMEIMVTADKIISRPYRH